MFLLICICIVAVTVIFKGIVVFIIKIFWLIKLILNLGILKRILKCLIKVLVATLLLDKYIILHHHWFV